MKKIASLLLSLLVCLSLLPGQAHALDLSEPIISPAQVEPLDLESPGEPESPVMPASIELFPWEESEELPKD